MYKPNAREVKREAAAIFLDSARRAMLEFRRVDGAGCAAAPYSPARL
jgi:hypothetical protein